MSKQQTQQLQKKIGKCEKIHKKCHSKQNSKTTKKTKKKNTQSITVCPATARNRGNITLACVYNPNTGTS